MKIDTLASNLIVSAFEAGVRIDMDYARRYINACELLRRSPDNEAAQLTVNHFQTLLSPLGRFMLPLEDWQKHCGTERTEAEEQQVIDDLLARCADLPPMTIVDKCAPYFRPHASVEGWKEGIRVFIARTGLTVEQIRAMSPAELAKYG